MSRKATLPASSSKLAPGSDTMDALEQRMAAAEKDTQELVDHLTQIGVPVQIHQAAYLGGNGEAISTFQPQIVANDQTLHKNYEQLVSRVCKSESALQSLKLNLMKIQAERDLSRKEKHIVSEKLTMAADAYDAEIKKLSKEIDYLRKECTNAWNAKKEATDELKRMELAFEEAQNSNSAVVADCEDMRAQKQKLSRRINELKEELSRETGIRTSLEESHKSLLQRIKDMEEVVQAEREEVQILSSSCDTLKRDSKKATEETDLERNLRIQLQDQIRKTTINEEIARQKVLDLEEDRNKLMLEVGRIGNQYSELNQQLDAMKALLEDKESTKVTIAANQHQELFIKELQQKLKEESQSRAEFERNKTELEMKNKDLNSTVSRLQKQLDTADKQKGKDSTHFNKQLRLLEEEKERMLQEKDALLDEVNQAVDSMAAEKGRLENEIEEFRLEMRNLENGKATLEAENRRLLERINSLEDSKASHKQIDQSLQEMMEQKNKLAYDKGKLQTRVDHLQKELEELANARTDLTQMKKTNNTLEAKLNKTQLELHDSNLSIQRLTSQLEHSSKSTDRKEKDFELAIKARDEAYKETQRLLAHVDSLEARDRQKASNMQLNLADVRSDNKQLSGTLEGVMQSHTRLQKTLENLQIELGKKDTLIADLNQEKIDYQHRVYQLQKENESLSNDMLSMKAYESTEINPLRKDLMQCKEDNTKMASSMETLLVSNNQLQGTVESYQDELEKKSHMISQIKNAREQDHESHKQEIQIFEERLSNLKQQLVKERDKSLKKTNKDVAEVRKQLEDILSKNGELSRANCELRQKITEIEYQLKEQKEKLSRHKHTIEHLTKIRQKQDEAIKNYEGISEQITELEKSKAHYVKKNKEQAHTIQNFVSQIAGLQAEITTLAQAQVDTTIILQEQEEQLRQEKDEIDQWKRKYREAKKHHLVYKESYDKYDTGDESVTSAEDNSHVHYKSQLEALKKEVARSRKIQKEREKENVQVKNLLEEEKQKAEKIAKRAHAMIKSSRETINRLANHAEQQHLVSKKQMHDLKAQLEAERETSMNASEQLRSFQDSSLRHAEELARELNFLKSQTLTYDST